MWGAGRSRVFDREREAREPARTAVDLNCRTDSWLHSRRVSALAHAASVSCKKTRSRTGPATAAASPRLRSRVVDVERGTVKCGTPAWAHGARRGAEPHETNDQERPRPHRRTFHEATEPVKDQFACGYGVPLGMISSPDPHCGRRQAWHLPARRTINGRKEEEGTKEDQESDQEERQAAEPRGRQGGQRAWVDPRKLRKGPAGSPRRRPTRWSSDRAEEEEEEEKIAGRPAELPPSLVDLLGQVPLATNSSTMGSCDSSQSMNFLGLQDGFEQLARAVADSVTPERSPCSNAPALRPPRRDRGGAVRRLLPTRTGYSATCSASVEKEDALDDFIGVLHSSIDSWRFSRRASEPPVRDILAWRSTG